MDVRLRNWNDALMLYGDRDVVDDGLEMKCQVSIV